MRNLTIGALSVTFLTATHLFAQLRFEYGVDLSVENEVATDRRVDDNALPVVLSIDNPPFGTASGRSHVGTGVNKAAATLHVASTAANPLVIGYANAYAYWYDRVTISDPTHNGEPGTFTASMLVNGAGNVTASGAWLSDPETELYAVWQAFIGVFVDDQKFQEDGWFGYWESNPLLGQLVSGGAPLGQVQTDLTFNFIFGEPFTLSGRLQTYMDVFSFNGTEGTFDSDLDLGNSAYWAGISAIRDGNGQVIAGANVTSASGVQWLNAINPGVTRGDFDGNGLVNLDDFNILAGNFGTNVSPWTFGDATGDGLVNLNDFNILAQHFGLPASATGPNAEDWSALGAAVPEPAMLGLALSFAGLLIRRR